jgi:outer membrane protein assembly factor BamB
MRDLIRRGLLGGTMALVLALPAPADSWPQWFGPKRDGIWRETGVVSKFPKGGPKVLWRAPLGTGYSGPSVAGGRVYVMDRKRALDKDGKPLRPTRAGHPGTERVLCLDARTGNEIWKREYDCPYTISYASGPRCTPLVAGGRVYTLGAMGHMKCLDAKTGKPIWEKDLVQEYKLDEPPVWGYAAHPLLDGGLLYTLVGGKGSAVVAFRKDTGKEAWKALTTDEVGYSPPMICTLGGKRQLVVWLSESLNGLDPATGKVLWTQEYPVGRAPERPAVNIATVRQTGDRLFISTAYHGPMMVEVDAKAGKTKVVWKGKSNSMARPDGLHALMASPVIKGGYVYGNGALGELVCHDAATGKKMWTSREALTGQVEDCGTVFLVPHGDRYVLFNDQGELILAELSPKGYKQLDRARILKPVEKARGRLVVWSHPAFANKCVYARNDKEMVCVSLAS